MEFDFDKYAQQKINNHPTEVDVEALWAAVEPQVKPKKKRRWFFWIFLLGLGFSIAGISWHTWQSNLEKLKLDTDILSSEKTIIDHQGIQPKITSEKDIQHRDSAIETNESKRLNVKTINPSQMEGKGRNRKFEQQLKNTPSPSKTIADTTAKELIYAETTTAKQPLENGIENQMVINTEGKLKRDVDFLAILDLQLLERNRLLTPLDLGTPKAFICPPNTKKWTLGLHAGWTPNFAHLDTVDAPQNNYLSTRKDSETQLETLHIGLDVSRQLHKHFYLKSGINYSRNTRRFINESYTTQRDTLPDAILAIVVNTVTNDTTFQTGELVLNNTQIERNTRFNQHHSIDIPIQLGFKFNKNRWAFGAEAGILVNVLTKRKGTIFDEDNTFYDLKKDEQNWFKKNTGISAIVAAKAAYQFNENWSITASPTYRFSNKLSTNDNPIRERTRGFGINLGIQKHF